eukprot:4373546-Prymnesium_polylepis.1
MVATANAEGGLFLYTSRTPSEPIRFAFPGDLATNRKCARLSIGYAGSSEYAEQLQQGSRRNPGVVPDVSSGFKYFRQKTMDAYGMPDQIDWFTPGSVGSIPPGQSHWDMAGCEDARKRAAETGDIRELEDLIVGNRSVWYNTSTYKYETTTRDQSWLIGGWRMHYIADVLKDHAWGPVSVKATDELSRPIPDLLVRLRTVHSELYPVSTAGFKPLFLLPRWLNRTAAPPHSVHRIADRE